jgi:hypothetical protein
MINTLMRFDCDECNGVGLIFWGNDLDYDVEKCDCNDFALGDLFTSGEAN